MKGAGRDARRFAQPGEPFGQPSWRDRRRKLVAENEILIDIGGSRQVALQLLGLAMVSQDIDRAGVQRDRALAAPRLRRPEGIAGVHRDQLLLDPKAAASRSSARQVSPNSSRR